MWHVSLSTDVPQPRTYQSVRAPASGQQPQLQTCYHFWEAAFQCSFIFFNTKLMLNNRRVLTVFIQLTSFSFFIVFSSSSGSRKLERSRKRLNSDSEEWYTGTWDKDVHRVQTAFIKYTVKAFTTNPACCCSLTDLWAHCLFIMCWYFEWFQMCWGNHTAKVK